MVVVTATTVTGCSGTLDPVVTVLEIPERPVSDGDERPIGRFDLSPRRARFGGVRQAFDGIPEAEHFITIRNGSPGLAGFRAIVNGQGHALSMLKANDDITLDVSASMAGGNNRIILLGYGRPGTSALVVISDVGGRSR